MKFSFFHAFLIFFNCLMLYSCEESQEQKQAVIPPVTDSMVKTIQTPDNEDFAKRCSILQITPMDEAAKDTSLLHFITHLTNVVAQKNSGALLELLAYNIVTSHGGGETGEKDFITHWNLQKDPASSMVWKKLERAIALGGCFDKLENDSVFILPYLQAPHYFRNGCDFDWFLTYICINPHTPIRTRPDKTSPIVIELGYHVLVTDLEPEELNSFVKVHTVDRKITGYVSSNDVYLCADYMLVLQKEDGNWSIKAFSPYD